MSGPFGSSQWMYSSGGFYEFPIEQSLKFNDSDNSYLNKSFATTGTDRKKFTFSCWYKKTQAGAGLANQLINNFNGSAEYAQIAIDANDRLEVYSRPPSNVTHTSFITSARLRDPSAWYHIFVSIDSTQATASDRVKIYINGVLQTAFDSSLTPAQNTEMNYFVAGRPIAIGRRADGGDSSQNLDGYLAEVNLIDGQGLSVTDFGEFKSGVWIPKDPSGITYGTNGFRLSFQNDTVSEGFNAVTYRGAGATQSINGIGFAPDLVWVKNRDTTNWHNLYDSVRGATKELFSNSTTAETTTANSLLSFDADGFTVGAPNDSTNKAGSGIVAWCWDAGSGSPVSNTSGSITSTVKANAAYGMSVISYTGNGTTGATVGHGLSSAPEMIIVKNRDIADNWAVYHSGIGATHGLNLNATTAAFDWDRYWNDTAPTSSVFTVGGPIVDAQVNGNGNDIIAYAFHSVAGYSKVGSYSGSGSAGNAVTTGFKPAFVMVKRTDTTSDWQILDATRDTSDARNKALFPSDSRAEISNADNGMDFTDTGFELNGNGANANASGGTYAYIAFADTRDNAFWRDQSGNGNDWQPNNLTYQDSLPDSPTGNNFAVLNPLTNTGGTFTEGNLQYVGPSSSRKILGTTGVSTGKWYWEVAILNAPESRSSTSQYNTFGFSLASSVNVTTLSGDSEALTFGDSGYYRNFTGSWTDGGTAIASGDVLACAVDLDAGTFAFKKNNVDIVTGSIDSTVDGKVLTPHQASYNGSFGKMFCNFGQDSSFAGNKTAQGNTDDNGIGDFYHSVPSGFLALCSANLPTLAIDPAQDDVPSDYFNTVLYTGNGSTQSVTVGWQPDFTWIKSRTNGGRWHALFDAVRGTERRLFSNDTSAEDTTANTLTSFDSDGFTLGSQAGQNGSGDSFVAWNWLAGNGTSSNTSGSISSTISVNQKAGFSVVGYTGNGTAGSTIGHGLNATPKLMIVKSRPSLQNWAVYHSAWGNGGGGVLNLTNAFQNQSGWWNNTSPTSSVFTVGGSTGSDWFLTNKSGDAYIAYCFAEVEGYSKFGSYTGNGSTDGPFVFTNHRPSWLLIKNASTGGSSWVMMDDARDPYNRGSNGSFNALAANSSGAEDTGASGLEFFSNGFKLRQPGTSLNNSGDTYIFMSFSSNPFKYANAR